MTARPTFTCPECRTVREMHWLDEDSGLCLSCAAKAGEPCRGCGKPIATDGVPCADCWINLQDLPTFAQVKAMFAGEDALPEATALADPALDAS